MTPRPDVALEPLEPSCAGAMFRWMNDPAVAQGLGLRSRPTPERTRDWIAEALRDPKIRAFAIRLGGRHVGNVMLDRIDDHLGSARLSAYVGEADARSIGVGRSAILLALRSAFGDMRLRKVWLTVHPRNAPAIAAYARLGFSLEGVLREEFRLGDEWLPALYMGLLRGEFARIDGEEAQP